MGRKQSWDRAEVLAAAMALFRRRGYEGSSLRDIEQATGLHPGSLYRAFDSKDGLFLAVLQSYQEQVVQARVREHLLDAADPLVGIRTYFTSTFATGAQDDPGCLLTNTAVESFALPQAALQVQHGLGIIEAGFADALSRARTAGLLPGDADLAVLATTLLGLYQGLLVLVRAGAPASTLERLADGAVLAVSGQAARS